MRVKNYYKVIFREGVWNKFGTPKEVIVDVAEKDEVFYMFSVYLDDPNVDIYLYYNDGSSKKIVLEDI